ncbi:MAG TPA: phosphate ABC transporter substrate-binding protein [Pseudomonadales bacterium]|nr:phosphate ABC transporter substrate-binding protein [Pseudomonadales bacterium]
MNRLISGLFGAALTIGVALAGAAAPGPAPEPSETLGQGPDEDLWSIQQVDPSLPAYARSSDVTGTISSVGSDTMVNLMTLWAEAFQHHYPNVAVQVQGAGSSTSPPALTEGTALFGPMSRRMKPREIEAFEARHGYRPTAIRVAVDALAVFVHRDNPLEGIVLSELDAVFSATRRCGRRERIDAWNQLGLNGSWADRPIQLFGRNSVSGTYGYFKDSALCHGDFRPTVNEQPGSASVVQAVATSLNGIGYSGMGYRTSGIRSLAIARRPGAPMIAATAENATAGTYPLARYLYLYINKRPDTALRPLEREFVRMVLSREGQQIVVKDGYVPLPAAIAARELAKL